MITLSPCPKGHTYELDKTRPPAETVRLVREKLSTLAAGGVELLLETRRVDIGRLGIPVFLSVCGESMQSILPTRKQMGKGASPEQAEASALMELMERFGFFTYWQQPPVARLRWSDAQKRFGTSLIPLDAIRASVHDPLAPDLAVQALDCLEWDFRSVTNICTGEEVMAPMEWFRKLGEFNGSSAGNTTEESLLQGVCELVERHVCCLIDNTRPTLPTIDTASITSPLLADLIDRFTRQGIRLILKDFSHGMPVPTIGALAYDPATFPESSEIVFTAGTASSPEKAAIRAVTEVAQLAGDFITHACYEASGLPKFRTLEEAAWVFEGPSVPLSSLPSLERSDITEELRLIAEALHKQGLSFYAADTTNALTQIPTHYSIVPGLAFRERDKNASIGLFVGRILAEEEEDPGIAHRGIDRLDALYGGAHFTPFFHGLISVREGDLQQARAYFATALTMQPGADALALCAFYYGYSYTLDEQWRDALPYLMQAVELCPDMKEYRNLLGVCHFKVQDYEAAAREFTVVITELDKGSVMDLANLGVCHKCMGKTREARQYLSAALSLDPTHQSAKVHLAELEDKA